MTISAINVKTQCQTFLIHHSEAKYLTGETSRRTYFWQDDFSHFCSLNFTPYKLNHAIWSMNRCYVSFLLWENMPSEDLVLLHVDLLTRSWLHWWWRCHWTGCIWPWSPYCWDRCRGWALSSQSSPGFLLELHDKWKSNNLESATFLPFLKCWIQHAAKCHPHQAGAGTSPSGPLFRKHW